MNFAGENFEPRYKNGNGNGASKEKPEVMLRSRLGAIRGKIEALGRTIYAMEVMLSGSSKELGEAGRNDLRADLESAAQELSRLLEKVREIESEISN